MRLLISHLMLAVVLTACGFSQDSTTGQQQRSIPDSGYVLQNVIIRGNELTKDFVIIREMSLKQGSRITEQALAYDRERIYSLGLFNRVEIWTAPTDSVNADILVEVHERWYLFPYPILGIRDRDWSRLYYGVGLLHYNFRGRDEKLSCSLVLGYNPSVSLYYRNPFLDQAGTTFLEAQIALNKVSNRSQQFAPGESDYDERHVSFGLTVGKRLGIENTFWLSAGYEIVDLSGHIPVRTLSPGGVDRYPIFGFGYTYDTRDLASYPAYGTLLAASVTTFGMPSDFVNYIRYAADARRYIPLPGNLVLTGRIFTNLVAAGPLPAYNHVYFGYSERIRGHFKEILEGENIFGMSSEFHVPIVPARFFTVGFLPSAFSVWKFALIGTVFGDAGTTWYRGEPLAVDQLVKGYGCGLNVLLAYDAVLRFEYAWNEHRQGQFILDAGTSF